MKLLFLNPDRNNQHAISSLSQRADVHVLAAGWTRPCQELGLETSDTVFIAETRDQFYELLDRLCEEQGYEYIFPNQTDDSSELLGRINDLHRLPGLTGATAERISSKKDYYSLFEKLDIPHPKLLNRPKFPCIVKPNKGSAGTGVMLIENHRHLIAHLRGRDDMLLQEYIPGAVCSLTGHVYKGKSKIDLIYDVIVGNGSYPVELGSIAPSRYTGIVERELCDYMDKFFAEIGLDNSAFMLDFIVSNRIYIIDFGARCNRYTPSMMRLLGEQDYEWKLTRRLCHGEEFSLDLQGMLLCKNLGLDKGQIRAITCKHEKLAEVLWLPEKEVTALVDDHSVFNSGYAMIRGNSISEMEQKLSELKDSIEISYLPEKS